MDIRYAPGDIVVHQLTGLRGVVMEVDRHYCGPDASLSDLTGQRGPKRSPWYHVAFEGAATTVYIAECNLLPDPNKSPIQHPMISSVFTDFADGRYIRLNH